MKRFLLVLILGMVTPLLVAGEDAPPDNAAGPKNPPPALPNPMGAMGMGVPGMGGPGKVRPGAMGGPKGGAAAARGGPQGAGTPQAGGPQKGKPLTGTGIAKEDAEKKAAEKKAAAEEAEDESKNDFIEMVTGDLIYGKIHKELPECIIMLLHKNKARITVPREKIKTLNYSMDSRLSALEKDDLEGHYKVGLWAMEKNMYPEAINLFEDVKKQTKDGKEGAGTDLFKQLGKAYEARGQLDKAYENYKEYMMGHADDSEVAELVKKIEPQVKPKEPDAKTAAAEVKNVDGLEADGDWRAETWGNPATVQPTTDKAGNKMVVVQSSGGNQDKMAFSRYGQALNLSDSSEMVFKAFNDGDKPINIACGFVNAEGEFYESRLSKVMPKTWTSQSFKIDAKVFKSTRNDFKEYNQDLRGREHIARITFMVYDQRPFKLFIDGFFFK